MTNHFALVTVVEPEHFEVSVLDQNIEYQVFEKSPFIGTPRIYDDETGLLSAFKPNTKLSPKYFVNDDNIPYYLLQGDSNYFPPTEQWEEALQAFMDLDPWLTLKRHQIVSGVACHVLCANVDITSMFIKDLVGAVNMNAAARRSGRLHIIKQKAATNFDAVARTKNQELIGISQAYTNAVNHAIGMFLEAGIEPLLKALRERPTTNETEKNA